jgi:integrase
MATVLLPYIDVGVPYAGKIYYYYRRVKFRKRLPGQPGEPDFNRAYEAAHAAYEAASNAERDLGPVEKSIAHLIREYRKSPDWRAKKPATKTDYEKALRPLEEHFGGVHVPTVPRGFVFGLRNQYASKPGKPGDPLVETPRRANRMVAVLSILLSYAVNLGWRSDNPALRPDKLASGPGWRSWTDEELEKFLTAETTPNELRLAALLASATGQRGQDLIAMRWSDYDGSAIRVKQQKTGALVWVPLHSRATDALAKVDRTAETLLTRTDGKPWKIDHFRHCMAEAIKAAGLDGVVTHGLRATAARWLAEAGCSEREIMAITGHTTASSVAKYVREADQRLQATSAMAKVERHRENSLRIAIAKTGE